MHHTTTSTMELQRLLGRAMVDAAFRAELIQNPAGVAEREGVSLTADDVAMLSKIDQFASDQVAQRQGTQGEFWS